MLNNPDGQRAASLRRDFTATVVADWRKVIAFVDRWAGLPNGHGRLLADALDEAGTSDALSRSEFFHHYLVALDCVNREDKQGARTMVTSLGNVLLLDAAEGRVSGELPVVSTAAGVEVPGAAPGAAIPARPVAGVLDRSAIRSHAGAIRSFVDETWLMRPTAGRALGVRGLTRPVAGEIEKYEEKMYELYGGPSNLRVLDTSSDKGSDVLDRLQAGYRLIQGVDPALAQEIAQVTEYVVPLDGQQFVGGSDIVLYGASFLRLQPVWTSLCFADHIIHEEAHQLLHAAQELEPLLLNRDQTGQPSPIRTDERPLYGTFHATFVFLRLASFMRRVVDSGDETFRAEAEVRLHRHLLGLLQGLRIVVDHADLSARGAAEVASWSAVAKDLVAHVGEPDPSLYARLDQDYEVANGTLPLLAV